MAKPFGAARRHTSCDLNTRNLKLNGLQCIIRIPDSVEEWLTSCITFSFLRLGDERPVELYTFGVSTKNHAGRHQFWISWPRIHRFSLLFLQFSSQIDSFHWESICYFCHRKRWTLWTIGRVHWPCYLFSRAHIPTCLCFWLLIDPTLIYWRCAEQISIISFQHELDPTHIVSTLKILSYRFAVL